MNKRSIAFLLFLLFSVAAVKADAISTVVVNTGAYQGQAGYLDLQLGRGPDSQSVSVSATGFASNGSLSSAAAQVAGSVSGALPNTVTLTNSAQFNDYFRGFTYGTNIAFQVTFTGPAINSPNGTAAYGSPFYFGLYNASQMPIGPADAFGNALLIQVNTNGSTTPTVYNSVISVSNSNVPEPSSYGLMAVALGTLGWRLRKKRT